MNAMSLVEGEMKVKTKEKPMSIEVLKVANNMYDNLSVN